MFFNKGTKKKSSKKQKNKEPTYWERVMYGKGTVAEPWPTAEELWDNVKEEAKSIQSTLNIQRQKNKS